MAASTETSPVHETDITVLKETLRSQQQLLQKLYAELDVEREAAATATNEALSMILRLQGEKAAMKMEASQYKRLAEEKISHAEESLAIFEELMYQKEMEISALEFQIEAYKYKLMSLGCDELDDFDKKFPENPFAERNGEKGAKSTMRRLSSLPSLFPTDFYKMKSSSDGKKHAVPAAETSSSIGAGNTELLVRDNGLDSRRSSPRSVDFNSFWEQIRTLDEKVKEISDCKEVGKNKLPKIKVKAVSQSTSPRAKLPPKCRIKTCEGSSEKATPNSANSSNTVHDVFEVQCKFEAPESSERNKSCFNGEKNKGKSYVEEDNRLKKPDLFLIGSPVDDDSDWFSKDDFQSLKPGKKGYKLIDEMNPDPDPDYVSPVEYDTEWIKMTNLQGTKHEKRSCNPSDETNDDCKSSLLPLSTGITNYRSELRLLAQRVEQLEGRRNNTEREISEGREDELNLLKQLREQLNSIQSEMRSWRPKKSSPSDEVHLLPLLEVCLSYSFQFLVANCI
ncbi:hypothetical protein Goklo_013802 [Gossypium klotzschianum]|uniref:GTD-binding domain-containing protein n=1 Tax=Gossypium klotzschianum TaxID=34286 RepID=A0A7J8U5R3_9ROSI|nr:hypothetical protein [Gossypium klotzschianum]